MRIVGGKFRGRTIHAPDGRATRPTTDRVREAIFNRLEHGVPDFSIDSARVLDLFAGTGALGLGAMPTSLASSARLSCGGAMRRSLAHARR